MSNTPQGGTIEGNPATRGTDDALPGPVEDLDLLSRRGQER